MEDQVVARLSRGAWPLCASGKRPLAKTTVVEPCQPRALVELSDEAMRMVEGGRGRCAAWARG